MPRLLPLFPLQLVALPGAAIPLHIFEERYREMVGEAAAAGTEFGIVLAKDGGIVNVGCTVIVEKISARYEDGSFDVLTRGRRRFLLTDLDREKPYLRGEVEFFEDDDGNPDSGRGSFQLAEQIEDLDFKSLILRSRSESERLKQIAEWIPRQQYVARMKTVTPTNGKGHKPAELP